MILFKWKVRRWSEMKFTQTGVSRDTPVVAVHTYSNSLLFVCQYVFAIVLGLGGDSQIITNPKR